MAATNRIAEQLVKQFDSTWKMLRQSIENVPDEKWAIGVEKVYKPWAETKGMNVWYFSERVYHIIQTIEFYSDEDPSVMKWGSRIGGIDWKSESPEVTAARIEKEEMLNYLEETKKKLEKKLRSFSDEELFETDGFSEWQESRYAKFLYTMRHSMWHIGELSRTLRDYECERTNWR